MDNNIALKNRPAAAGQLSRTRTMIQIAMLSAVAAVLMLFDFALPFAPGFYKLDFSEVPVLIGSFAMGPFAGACIEFTKILLNLVMNSNRYHVCRRAGQSDYGLRLGGSRGSPLSAP